MKHSLAKFKESSQRFDSLKVDIITEILRLTAAGAKVGILAIAGALVYEVRDWGVTIHGNDTGGITWEHMTLDSILQLNQSLL